MWSIGGRFEGSLWLDGEEMDDRPATDFVLQGLVLDRHAASADGHAGDGDGSRASAACVWPGS